MVMDFIQNITVKDGAGTILHNTEMSMNDNLDDKTQKFTMIKVYDKSLISKFVNNEETIDVTAKVFNEGKIFKGYVKKNKQTGNYIEIEFEGMVHKLDNKAHGFTYENEEIKKVVKKIADKFGFTLVWDDKIKNEKISRSEIMESEGSDDSGGDVVTGTGKPSCSYCSGKLPYKEYTASFKNKCGNCGKTGVLQDNPKGTSEGEWTCSDCDSDFCKVCGKEKMDPPRSWLVQVDVPTAVKKNQ